MTDRATHPGCDLAPAGVSHAGPCQPAPRHQPDDLHQPCPGQTQTRCALYIDILRGINEHQARHIADLLRRQARQPITRTWLNGVLQPTEPRNPTPEHTHNLPAQYAGCPGCRAERGVPPSEPWPPPANSNSGAAEAPPQPEDSATTTRPDANSYSPPPTAPPAPDHGPADAHPTAPAP